MKYVNGDTSSFNIVGQIGDGTQTTNQIDNLSDVVQIDVGTSVTSIGDGAFFVNGNSLTNLTSVSMNESVSYIGKNSFLRVQNLSTVVIPNSVTYIGDYAFSYTTITSLTLPRNISYIGTEAFSSGPKFLSVIIPGSLSVIDSNSFADNYLNTLIIENGVLSINNGAFSKGSEWQVSLRKSLSSVELPNGLLALGSSVFSGNKQLLSIHLPGSLIYTGQNIFKNCTALKNVQIDKTIDETSSLANYSWSLPTGCTITCTNGIIQL